MKLIDTHQKQITHSIEIIKPVAEVCLNTVGGAQTSLVGDFRTVPLVTTAKTNTQGIRGADIVFFILRKRTDGEEGHQKGQYNLFHLIEILVLKLSLLSGAKVRKKHITINPHFYSSILDMPCEVYLTCHAKYTSRKTTCF